MTKLAAVSDYRAAARARLPRFLFDYLDGAANDELTARANIDDLARLALRQRVLRDVSAIDTAAKLCGASANLPVALGPIGLAGMLARRGEVQAARAAEQAGVPFCLSTVSICALAEVRRAVTKPFWFQLYMIRDRGFMRELLAEARAAQCSALVFTVDMPVAGARYRDHRSGLSGAPGLLGALRRAAQGAMHPAWALDVGLFGHPHHLGNVVPVLNGKSGLDDFFAWLGANFDPAVTWKDLDFVRESWTGPLILKGILDVEDAVEGAALGADAIIVSNHGGRQLDGVVSTARALPSIADAVGHRLEVLADGGVRSGADIMRMMAQGARGVLLGRAWAYGLAARGEAGILHVLGLLGAELRTAMALTGVQRLAEIDRSVLYDRA